MFWFIALSATAEALSPASATAQAAVRIERPARVGQRQWRRAPEAQRRELVVKDQHGSPILLRLIEFP